MKKIAFVFPGQGTQFVGMGKSLYDNHKEAREVFDIASESLGIDMAKLCFSSSEEELLQTKNQQPAIHTTEIAILRTIEKYNVQPFVTAGFSLGEFGALVCAKSLRFEDTVQLVKKRGLLMQDAVPEGVGKMLAITGLSRDNVFEIVDKSTKYGHIECSNFNCPGQIIVSGHKEAVENAEILAGQAGAKNTAYLKVSGPFHTSLLTECGRKLREELKKVEVKTPSINFIPNVTAKLYSEGQDIRELLDLHVSKAVLWEDTIDETVKMGVDAYVELGPKGSLIKFIERTLHKNNASAKLYHIEDVEGLEKFLKDFS